MYSDINSVRHLSPLTPRMNLQHLGDTLTIILKDLSLEKLFFIQDHKMNGQLQVYLSNYNITSLSAVHSSILALHNQKGGK